MNDIGTTRVLVIANDPSSRNPVAPFLTDHGFDVSVSPPGDAAVNAAAELSPKLVVLDDDRNYGDRHDRVRRLRECIASPSLPVIHLYDPTEHPHEWIGELGSGFDTYLAKPYDPNALVAVVRSLTDSRQPSVAPAARELFLQRIAEVTPGIVNVFDVRERRCVFINRAITSALGYLPEDLIRVGSDIERRMIHPDDAGLFDERLAQFTTLADGEATEFEHRFRDASGAWRWFLSRYAVFGRDEDGAVRYVIGTAVEITTSKLARQRLHQSEQRLRALYDGIDEYAWLLTPDGTLLTANRASLAFGESDVDNDMGQAFWETVWFRFTPGAPDRIWESISKAAHGERVRFETKLIGPSGEATTFDISFEPIRDDRDAVTQIVVEGRNITERKRAETALRESEARFRLLADSAPVMIWTAGPETRCDYFNRPWLEFTGRTLDEDVRLGWAADLHPDDRDGCVDLYLSSFEKRAPFRMEFRLRRRDGQYRWLLDTGTPRFSPGGVFLGFIGTCLDVTDQKLLHQQLLESQKLESVGRLAGGIAHDFNNLLTAILGHLDLANEAGGASDEALEHLDQVRLAAERAADLTSKMLSFARKQIIIPTAVDVSEAVRAIDKLLSRPLGERITLVTRCERDGLYVLADQGQFTQALVNLIINARDAMPAGGTIEIGCDLERHAEPHATHGGALPPGDYVAVWIRDEGGGIDDSVRSHLFEPFFTTKEIGKGTGLGLSSVYGAVSQMGGGVRVEADPGRGATFTLVIPSYAPVAPTVPPEPSVLLAGTETILLVEDEPMLLDILSNVLRGQGYNVLPAHDGATALHIASSANGPIHLLVTDVVMPGIGGTKLAEVLLGSYPDLAVAFTSGYTELGGELDCALGERSIFIPKPYTPRSFAKRIRELLDRERVAS